MSKLDPRRWQLCSAHNALVVALRLCEETGRDQAVVRTRSDLQPFKVCPDEVRTVDAVELRVVRL